MCSFVELTLVFFILVEIIEQGNDSYHLNLIHTQPQVLPQCKNM